MSERLYKRGKVKKSSIRVNQRGFVCGLLVTGGGTLVKFGLIYP